MTKALDDILREPRELRGILDRLTSNGAPAIRGAAAALDLDRPLLVIGIGSSYNAAVAVAAQFARGGVAAQAVDASEALHAMEFARGTNALILSRSGRSVEIVRLLDRLEGVGARVLAVTNTPDSPLGQRAQAVADMGAAFDNNVSFTMYAGLGLAGGLIAAALGRDLGGLTSALAQGLTDAEARLPTWRAAIEESAWLASAVPAYFLARGASLASALETRLLWEEVAKAPASALTTGGFRHGSQEAVRAGLAIGLWLDPQVLTAEDRSLAADLRAEGAGVMVIGADLAGVEADLALEVPAMPPGWQFLVDVMPAQLVSERLAARRGEDPDGFRYCSFVVEGEAGLRVGATA
jgi:glucosamine--fructose-6-phosphate aminotransferase (isomerizing)